VLDVIVVIRIREEVPPNWRFNLEKYDYPAKILAASKVVHGKGFCSSCGGAV
jgi:hypothetical protein